MRRSPRQIQKTFRAGAARSHSQTLFGNAIVLETPFPFALAHSPSFAQNYFVKTITEKFAALSTPLGFDAPLRLKLPLRVAPSGIAPVVPGSRAAGRVLPAKHFGSEIGRASWRARG